MGADEQPLDLLSSGRFDFIGVTDSTLYPLQTVQHGPRIMSVVDAAQPPERALLPPGRRNLVPLTFYPAQKTPPALIGVGC